jgi:hypothetical protein
MGGRSDEGVDYRVRRTGAGRKLRKKSPAEAGLKAPAVKVGGGTNIANELVARSDPNGHTVWMGGSSQAATRGLHGAFSCAPCNQRRP